MPETPTWGLPYPESSTLITDSAAIVQTLAEKIDTALSQVTASDSYTVPGTLVEDFTASGTFTPPPGVTVVSVVVVGGGGLGGYYDGGSGGGGAAGGEVAVYRDVPVSGPVTVTIGGSETDSSFGALIGRAGMSGPQSNNPIQCNVPAPGWNGPLVGSGGNGGINIGGSYSAHAGYNGPTVNGTYYGGGGGGADLNGVTRMGGQGGGGRGTPAPPDGAYWQNGVNGLGGGGGGGSHWQYPSVIQGLGGSGRVMIYTEQAYKAARNVPAPIDPEIDAALNVAGVVVGLVAVDPADPQAPGIPDATLVAYPDTPQPTGRMITVPVDPDDPDGPTHEIPETAWPVAGWTYHDGTWTPPPLGEDTP